MLKMMLKSTRFLKQIAPSVIWMLMEISLIGILFLNFPSWGAETLLAPAVGADGRLAPAGSASPCGSTCWAWWW